MQRQSQTSYFSPKRNSSSQKSSQSKRQSIVLDDDQRISQRKSATPIYETKKSQTKSRHSSQSRQQTSADPISRDELLQKRYLVGLLSCQINQLQKKKETIEDVKNSFYLTDEQERQLEYYENRSKKIVFETLRVKMNYEMIRDASTTLVSMCYNVECILFTLRMIFEKMCKLDSSSKQQQQKNRDNMRIVSLFLTQRITPSLFQLEEIRKSSIQYIEDAESVFTAEDAQVYQESIEEPLDLLLSEYRTLCKNVGELMNFVEEETNNIDQLLNE